MKKNKKVFKHTIEKQSSMHNALKIFFSRENNIVKPSQIKQRMDHKNTKVIILDEMAYWVSDNIFYTSNTINGRPNISEAMPVDIYSLPKKQLDKMLFILDNLGGGKNERGGTGN